MLVATHHMTLITRLAEGAGLAALHHVRNEGAGTVVDAVGTNDGLRKAVGESGLGIGRVWASGGFPGGR